MSDKRKVNRIDYAQFLLASQKNYTLTYFSDHYDTSHDAINRYLATEKLKPSLLWEHTKNDIIESPESILIFDDTILDKNNSKSIELSRWQYSGNAKTVIKGIGVVTCVYYNPEINRYWALDYRIYAPDQDGKTKLDHVEEMITGAIDHKKIQFKGVAMDGWYATHHLMLTLDTLGKKFYCPLKSNRLVSPVDQKYHHIPVSELHWSQQALDEGQRIHIRNFPNHYHVQLFRITMSNHRTDFVATNDQTQHSTFALQEVYGYRWKIEEMHRELKQITGIQNCQCRRQRIQRNHISCAFLVWAKLKQKAHEAKKTVYQLKQGLWREYMIQQLRSPAIKLEIA